MYHTHRSVASVIATAIGAEAKCAQGGNQLWEDRWGRVLDWIEKQHLPSGSGIDSGTRIDRARTTPDKVVLVTSFHHMNEHGMYDGWTDHVIFCRPAFDGITVSIGGRDRNGIKDYLHEVFWDALSAPCQRYNDTEHHWEYGWYFQDKWVAHNPWE